MAGAEGETLDKGPPFHNIICYGAFVGSSGLGFSVIYFFARGGLSISGDSTSFVGAPSGRLPGSPSGRLPGSRSGTTGSRSSVSCLDVCFKSSCVMVTLFTRASAGVDSQDYNYPIEWVRDASHHYS